MDLDHILNTLSLSHLAGLRRLEMDSEDLTELARPPVLSVPVLLVVLPPPPGVVPRFKDLKRTRESSRLVVHLDFKTDLVSCVFCSIPCRGVDTRMAPPVQAAHGLPIPEEIVAVARLHNRAGRG